MGQGPDAAETTKPRAGAGADCARLAGTIPDGATRRVRAQVTGNDSFVMDYAVEQGNPDRANSA
jgi:hypothetical protein